MSGHVTSDQGKLLLALARKTLSSRFAGTNSPEAPTNPAFLEEVATFVTLKIAGQLRGCIGNLEPVGTLWQGIRDNVINAAFHDHRFSPLKPEELSQVHVDISILSPPVDLEYSDADDLLKRLRPGIDGVILRDGNHRSTFLPQVWEQLPDPSQFLNHLCLKAGLAKTVWREKQIEIQTYFVQCFSEENK
jgi:AmmeMemoRadiSam system protein A